MEEKYTPMARIAVFIDGWNFKYSTYDAFGIQVDFVKLLKYLTEGSILIRAYYYTGEWTTDSIDQYVKLSSTPDEQSLKEELEGQRRRSQSFYRFLNRNGYMVVRKPLKVFAGGAIKADLDLELAIDMLSLVPRCDKYVLCSGDGDFVPLVRAVAQRGVRIQVLSTQHQEAYVRCNYKAADELVDAADEFIELYDILDEITRD
ncbi:MAG TPA: NYN domain-containing protein [Bacillota bacterium]|nr:NYN domain-containing protein [Candidatus Fermentithermobacillaceae bacterium]HOB30397.1 NYN domain-containing protein [Bacillota bacterium]HOK64354.1 NYN domain-containing protein [Bacillota bacterium]HOL11955.1 NYN domain-containing protein [Bacillota bacterium]HOQ03006.1 NYN domain-containing protein [Bacillota bacterium]